MTIAGWTFLVISWSVIVGLCAYCFSTIFKVRDQNLVYPLEVETLIEKEQDQADREKP